MLTMVMLFQSESVKACPGHRGVGCDIQKAYREHQNDMDQLPSTKIQLDQLWNRNENDKDVENNINNGVSPSKGIEVDAMPFHLTCPAIPTKRNWCTMEDDSEREGDDECGSQDKTGNYDLAESLGLKYTIIEEENGGLGESNDEHVKDLGVPGELIELVQDGFKWEFHRQQEVIPLRFG